MWVLLTATGFFTPLDWVLSALLGVGIAAVLGLKTRGRLAQLRPVQA
jgi:ABC-type antimicrobial peptide transport system permease subunit